jgi:hypothetical protein
MRLVRKTGKEREREEERPNNKAEMRKGMEVEKRRVGML